MQDWNAVDDRKDAALAAKDTVSDGVAIRLMEQRRHQFEMSAAVRTPKDL